MADQLIYLVETVTAAMEDHDPVCLSDSGLAAKLGDGFEVISTMPTKKVTIGKKVSVTPMLLRQAGGAKNAVALHREQPSPRRDGFEITNRDEGYDGGGHSGGLITQMMSKLTTALTNLGDGASHLGAPRNHSMPGMTIVSGELVSKAWDTGMNAARCGHPRSSCPFPVGSEPATKWLQGYKKGAEADVNVGSKALGTIEEDAYALAKSLDVNDVVDCPYAPGSEKHSAWLAGFKRGGGRVEN
jgi:ribosome modulation factor